MNNSPPLSIPTLSNVDTVSDPFEALTLSSPVVLSSSSNYDHYDPFASCDIAGGNSLTTTWNMTTESATNHSTLFPNNDTSKAMKVIQENSLMSNEFKSEIFLVFK